MIGAIQGVLFTLTAAAFLAWFYRAYTNLPPLGAADLRYGRRWAIGAWFVPILNLWRPKQIANDIWRASDPDAPDSEGGAWRKGRVPRFFALWWGAFLLMQWLYNLGTRRTLRADEIAEFQAANGIVLAADLSSVIAAAFAIAVVRQTTDRQEARAIALGIAPEEVRVPLYRRRSAWATLAAVIVALGLQGAFFAAVWSGALDPPETEASDSRPRSDPDLLLQDDFADSGSGWLTDAGPTFLMGYAADAYRIQVTKNRQEMHSYRQLLEPVEGMRIEVEARMHDGSRRDGYGVGCWIGEEAGYYGAVFADGFYAITKDSPSSDEIEPLRRGTDRRGIIRRGGRPNALAFECANDGSGVVTLALSPNGKQLASMRDMSRLSSFTGIGLFTASVSGRTDVRFDNLVAQRLGAPV